MVIGEAVGGNCWYQNQLGGNCIEDIRSAWVVRMVNGRALVGQIRTETIDGVGAIASR